MFARKNPLALLGLYFGLALAILPAAHTAEAGGVIIGSVSNSATGNLLEGVRV